MFGIKIQDWKQEIILIEPSLSYNRAIEVQNDLYRNGELGAIIF